MEHLLRSGLRVDRRGFIGVAGAAALLALGYVFKDHLSIPARSAELDAGQLISQALAAGETGIHLPAGPYSVSQNIIVDKPNVEIYGDGSSSTVLRLDDSVLQNVLSFQRADNFYVHDLEIDGNKQNQPYTPSGVKYAGSVDIHGIAAWNCSNGIIKNCHVHDCRVFGISLDLATNCKVLNNFVEDSDANGITVSNFGGGNGNVVEGNTVDGASDVGITGWDAIDYTVQNNIVKNVSLNTSPFAQNSHIGIMAEGAGNGTGCRRCTYNQNIVENIVGSGMSSAPGTRNNSSTNQNEEILFEGNTLRNCGRGIGVNHNVGFRAINNVIDGILDPNGWAISVGSDASEVYLEGNQIQGLPTGMQRVVQLFAPTGTFKNNVIYTNGNTAIWVKYPTGWNITGNSILGSTSTTTTSNNESTSTTTTSNNVPEFSAVGLLMVARSVPVQRPLPAHTLAKSQSLRLVGHTAGTQ
jgi:parallel beta-helix repeat protein